MISRRRDRPSHTGGVKSLLPRPVSIRNPTITTAVIQTRRTSRLTATSAKMIQSELNAELKRPTADQAERRAYPEHVQVRTMGSRR